MKHIFIFTIIVQIYATVQKLWVNKFFFFMKEASYAH